MSVRDVAARPADVAGPAVREGGYFASVTIRLGSLQPETVLASPPAGVRGFWQSGAHWIAHAGSVAEINSQERASGTGSDDPDALFDWVRERADSLYGSGWVLDLDGDARRPRLHGGFAFDAERRPAGEPGFWEAFPSARFTLPAFEVEADASGARLTVTRRFEAGTPRDRAVDELRRRADRTREHLLELGRTGAAPGPVPRATAFDEPVRPSAWRAGIERILADIGAGTVRKVVLARPLDVTLARPPDSAGVLDALRTSNPLAHTYLVQFARDRFFVGASPELIASLGDGVLRTMAVGGSTPRGSDPESDEWLGRQLLGSRKNRLEHRIVVEDIAARLAEIGLDAGDPPDPALLRLPRIQHLRTEMRCGVPAGTHILDLVRALHPTAAVCGDPRPAARRVLAEEEGASRGWYAGPVGWMDEGGEGEFAPALRCAVCRGPLLRLYAGVGVVAGSRPRAEWDETRVKFQTMLSALGVARVP